MASFFSLFLRFRRSSGAERQQIKWVASAAALIPVAATGLGFGGDAGWPLILVAMLIVAIAVTVAMLRYRLYDIDVVINKAVVFALLAGFITAVYAAVVVGLGRLLPRGREISGWRSWRPRWSPWRSSRSGCGSSTGRTGWCTASGPLRTKRWPP